MKITVVIPSRGRPFLLMNVIRLLNLAASGKHEITYVIGCDADDPNTIAAGYTLRTTIPNVRVFCTERIGSLGKMANLMAERYPADVYCSLCDDVEPLTRDWDEAIYQAWLKNDDYVWWWRTLKERPATYAIVSHKWYVASGHRIFSDYFPFWWDDVWLMQVWAIASGLPGQAIDAVLDDRAFETQRMRDLKFWTDFYIFCRAERERQAAATMKALGWPGDIHESWIGDIRSAFVADIPNIEARQGDKRPPTPEYLAAKARAERLMQSDPKKATA